MSGRRLLNFDSGAVDEGTVLTAAIQEMALASVDGSVKLSRYADIVILPPTSAGRVRVKADPSCGAFDITLHVGFFEETLSFPAGGGDMTTAIEGGRLNAISTSAAPGGKVDVSMWVRGVKAATAGDAPAGVAISRALPGQPLRYTDDETVDTKIALPIEVDLGDKMSPGVGGTAKVGAPSDPKLGTAASQRVVGGKLRVKISLR